MTNIHRSLLAVLLLPLSMAAYGDEQTPDPSDAALRQQYARPATTPYPDDDTYSSAKEALGRTLFFDPLLSGSGQHSCATCHDPKLSFGDHLPLALGDTGHAMAFRTPTLLDTAFIDLYGWTGKFPTLEKVVFAPITAAGNLNLTESTLIARLSAAPVYARAFAAAFPDHAVNRKNISAALATYVRSIHSPEAPFDRWIMGDEDAVSPAAKRGFAIFNGKGNCAQCHSGWSFTDGSFHDVGVGKGKDIGRGAFFPTSVKLRYAFKTPTLRNVAERAPYMHDGSIATLEGVIDLYDRGGIDRPSRSELIHPLGLSAGEKADLLAFLKTLSGETEVAVQPAAPR
ncbi:cytochrome c peroxidase [Methylovirgula ligni]|uniref:Methylamine utilization protein MauG n=1 Tax=Methylovirgula ligni TaxID=569860 RepID=A0A3D9Z173_9HYPH|nr:cytochrome c peroxidase [Methylovirgula ligni]